MILQSDTEVLHLSDLKTGEEGIITGVSGHGAFRKRITEMGFVKGKKVRVVKNAPLRDPVEYAILDYLISLRRTEAAMIEVITTDADTRPETARFEGTLDGKRQRIIPVEKGKIINVALVGNPNSGKTSLYNCASGSHDRVGNYGGVTVDAHEATFRKSGYTFNVVDLPGTYSITEYTPEELYVRTYITDNKPDVVINVIDASNLERNLYLTTQLIDMDIRVVIALNMYDELQKKGAKLDHEALGKMIGIPIIPTVASNGKGIDELFGRIIDVYENRDPVVRQIHINYGTDIENAISRIQELIDRAAEPGDRISSRYLSIKMLERDSVTAGQIASLSNSGSIRSRCDEEIRKLERVYREKSGTVITDSKYGFIAGALNETYSNGGEEYRKGFTLDDILTHKYLGFPIFIFFMWAMFQVTFSLGSYPMDFIDAGVAGLADLTRSIMAEGPLRDLLVDGIIAGVGGVIIFLPNILILFFFISFMEDSGYMARASFIMDKLMHRIGLHGKSFIPMLMGFGCNVPAIMATRTLENRKDRLLTMMIIPFMSCSARLPIYLILISAFFASHQGLVLVSVYFIGIVIAILVALAMKKLLFAGVDVPFVMELPPYRIPTLKSTSMHMWHKGVQYIKKMGTVILLASILIWALGYFPRTNASGQSGQMESLEKSYIGQIGHFIEPVIKPLGFDWKIGVSILTGLAAKEVVVSTMGILYQADPDNTSNGLPDKLREQSHLTPLVAYGFMLFVLIYFPCIAAVTAIKKESDIKWAVFVMFYTTGIAWLVAFMTYRIGSLFI
jgi:ferrous iron transport protein B